MVKKIFLLTLFMAGLILVFPHRPFPESSAVPPAQGTGEAVSLYKDKDYQVSLNGRLITIAHNGSGRLTSLSLPTIHRPVTESGLQKAIIRRDGDSLRLSAEGTIYHIHLGPDAVVTCAYPNPGCGGDKIIVDKNKNILYLFKSGDLYRTYRIATGKKPEFTPEGNFSVINKTTIPPGTGNDRFGPRWIGLGVPNRHDLRSRKPDRRAPLGIKYGIHGTDEPWSIGTYASGGCIRLSNSDILDLFERVQIGTPVEIIK